MARPLAALERLLERLVERPIGRFFGAPLELVQVERRLGLAMDEGRRAAGGRPTAPDLYRVQLHAHDLAALLRAEATIEARLADMLLVRARSNGYSLVDRPRVTLHANRAVARGDVVVSASMGDGSGRGELATGRAAPVEATAILPTPMTVAPRVTLVSRAPGRPERRLPLEGAPIRIGRARDNDLVLPEARVSRHHGLLVARQGALVYRDLASANGTFLGSTRVGEVALGPGDVLTIGDTTLRLEDG